MFWFKYILFLKNCQRYRCVLLLKLQAVGIPNKHMKSVFLIIQPFAKFDYLFFVPELAFSIL